MATYGNPGSYGSYKDYVNAFYGKSALGEGGANFGASGARPLSSGAWQAERSRYYAPPPPSAPSVPAGGGAVSVGGSVGGGGVQYPTGTTGGATYGGGTSLSQMADPWMNERKQYMTQLSDLLRNPSAAMSTNPAFKFMQDEGLNAINRSAAAGGMLKSGNRLAALQERGTGVAAQELFRMGDLLGKLSGGFSQNPAAAAQAELSAAGLGLEQQKLNRLLNADAQTQRDARNAAENDYLSNFWQGLRNFSVQQGRLG